MASALEKGIRRTRKGRRDMCEAHAYILKEKEEKKILESVDLVEFDGDEIRLVSIFGEQKTLRGRLARYDSSGGKIVFKVV